MWFRKAEEELESKRALAESIMKLKETEDRAPEVDGVTSALRSLRERNHFAEQLQAIMGGPR